MGLKGGRGGERVDATKGVLAERLFCFVRVILLKALCEIRLDCNDARDRVDEAARVSRMREKERHALLAKAKAAQRRGGAPTAQELEDFRREPLGGRPSVSATRVHCFTLIGSLTSAVWRAKSGGCVSL
jgi:hypothetical protein